ncbi:proline racemase family protein [Thalassotalea profundi]|uniref:Proline racemase n=1 Tax=Thalassotalea profundi TaxID=2036687 RepID=A0ABQ3IKL2_9GAMM|nr:proline racemase family protein [Thalassotalea profundi]GHE86656.1 proline racemase [Thalassotalea profundi]
MQFNINKLENYQCISTIDAHTEGEPLRIITQGYPTIKGNTILEKRQYLTEHLDQYRKLLMFEPRGHADMYGALITEPCTKEAKFGILFMHNEGYSSMCGHGIIAAVSVAIETGALTMPPVNQAIGIDSPAGLIKAYVEYDKNKNIVVSFDNVPSFIEALNQSVEVKNLGKVDYDIAYGGAYYAFVDADKLGMDCTPANNQTLIKAGWDIKKAIMNSYSLQHPVEKELSFLYGTIFYSNKTTHSNSHSRHVCVFANGEVDRSPTGTGVSARAAILVEKEKLTSQKDIVIESIVNGKMTVNVQKTCDYHGKKAVIPRVSGRAFITGYHQFLLDHKDIFPQGFILR